MTWLYIILTLVASYLIGGIPFGLLAGMTKGKDLRKLGSGNIGATNAGRVMGRIWFFIVFAMDGGKGFLCAWAGYMLMDHAGADLALLASVGVLAGHFYSPYLHLQGGKGVATGFGLIFIVAIPPWTWVPGPALCALGVFFAVLILTRMVSAASMGAAVSVPGLYAIWMGDLLVHAPNLARFICLIVIAVFVVARHADNIKRILAGTESRIGVKRSA